MTEYTDADNQYAERIRMPETRVGPRKPPFMVAFSTSGFMNGAIVQISANVDINHVPRLIARLMELGMEASERPLRFDLTAEGNPICPRHKVPMRKKSKQGDSWYSHQVVDQVGEPHWCRGYPGPGSDGYHIEGPACDKDE